VVGDRIVFVGGSHHYEPGQEYDPATDSWRVLSRHGELYEFAVAELDGEVYVLGGNTETSAVSDGVEAYTPPSPRGQKAVSVGSQPFGVFSTSAPFTSGGAIWIASTADGTLTKIRREDGVVLGSSRVGVGPRGDMAFDGQHLWVTNTGDGTVSRVRASDGTLVQTVRVGSQPHGAAFAPQQSFDSPEATIWVANHGSGTVTRIRAADGVVTGTFDAGPNPTGIAARGDVVWVSTRTHVRRLRASDGAALGDIPAATPYGIIAVDGVDPGSSTSFGFVCFASHAGGTVSCLDENGAAAWTTRVGDAPVGLAFVRGDHETSTRLDPVIYVASSGSGTVTKLRAFDGAVLSTTSVGGTPYGVAADDLLHVWVSDHGGNTVRRIPQ
jgi:hypothetical protein